MRLVGCRRSKVIVRCYCQNVTIAGSEFAREAHPTKLVGALFTPHGLTYKGVHLILANMFVGAKHDLRQYGIITNNLYAVMLRPLQK